jgi:hypothetical protein
MCVFDAVQSCFGAGARNKPRLATAVSEREVDRVLPATTRRSGLLSYFNGSDVVRVWRMAAIRRAN